MATDSHNTAGDGHSDPTVLKGTPSSAAAGGVVHAVTLRAVLVGAALVAFFSWINPFLGFRMAAWWVGLGSLMEAPVLALVVLVALNGLVIRRWPARGFTRAELLVIYIMLTCSLGWLINGGLPFLVSVTTYPFYMASPANDWRHVIWPHIPDWFRVDSAEAVDWFWQGLPAGRTVPWGDWLRPGATWSVFTFLLWGAMFCLDALLRKDWVERQRLSFPLVEVPLSIVGDEDRPSLASSLMRRPAFLAGLALPVLMGTSGFLHRFWPSFPSANLAQLPVGRSFVGMGLPWEVLGDVELTVSWSTLGIMALLPSEVSLSIWFFYALSRVQLIAWAICGVGPGAGSSFTDPARFIEFEEAGGLIALAVIVLWASRDSLKNTWASLLGRRREQDDPYAPLTSRATALGFIFCNTLMLALALRLGMSWWAFAIMMGLYYLVTLAATRLIAASGVLFFHTGLYALEREVAVRILGVHALGPASSLVTCSYLASVYMDDPANLAMPHMMNSFKLSRVGQIAGRSIPWAVGVALVSLLAVSLPAILAMIYRRGAATLGLWPFTLIGASTFGGIDAYLRQPPPPDNWLRLAMAIGAVFVVVVSWLHVRFMGWPLSPIGFVIASGWATEHLLWFCAFLGWLLSGQIRRYGGLRLYRRVRPAFVGLIVGEVLTSSVLGIIDTVLRWHMLAG